MPSTLSAPTLNSTARSRIGVDLHTSLRLQTPALLMPRGILQGDAGTTARLFPLIEEQLGILRRRAAAPAHGVGSWIPP